MMDDETRLEAERRSQRLSQPLPRLPWRHPTQPSPFTEPSPRYDSREYEIVRTPKAHPRNIVETELAVLSPPTRGALMRRKPNTDAHLSRQGAAQADSISNWRRFDSGIFRVPGITPGAETHTPEPSHGYTTYPNEPAYPAHALYEPHYTSPFAPAVFTPPRADTAPHHRPLTRNTAPRVRIALPQQQESIFPTGTHDVVISFPASRVAKLPTREEPKFEPRPGSAERAIVYLLLGFALVLAMLIGATI